MDGLAKPVETEIGRTAQSYQLLSALPNLPRHVGNFIGDIQRDGLNTVTVAVNQVTGPDL